MNGAFKGLKQSDVYLTSYISKKQWQVTSGSFENLGISKIEAASGSSTYGSLRTSYYEGSIPDSGSFTGSYDLNLQSTITLQGSRRLPQNILAYFIPRDCFGESIEEGSVQITGETCKIYDKEGLLLLDMDEASTEDLQTPPLTPGVTKETRLLVAETFTEINTVVGETYRLTIKVPEDGDWGELGQEQCVLLEGATIEDPIYPGKDLRGEVVSGLAGQELRVVFTSNTPKVVFRWIENESRVGTTLSFDLVKMGGKKTLVLGDIIYTQGLILLNADKISLNIGSLAWTSKVTINTWNVRCVVKDLEYNYSYNGSVSGSNAVLMGTSEFTPYITTVGLYNRAGELMAVAKLSKPIRKNDNIDMTFRVNIDIS